MKTKNIDKEGICPFCESDKIKYTNWFFELENINIEYKCLNCNALGEMKFLTNFIGNCAVKEEE